MSHREPRGWGTQNHYSMGPPTKSTDQYYMSYYPKLKQMSITLIRTEHGYYISSKHTRGGFRKFSKGSATQVCTNVGVTILKR